MLARIPAAAVGADRAAAIQSDYNGNVWQSYRGTLQEFFTYSAHQNANFANAVRYVLGGGTNTTYVFYNTTNAAGVCTTNAAGLNVVAVGIGTNTTFLTNTVSVLNFSNSVLSSHFFTLLESNYFVFTGSNYLGSFPQLQSWYLLGGTAGGGGTTPQTNSIENLFGSTNGGTGWFQITNATPNITNTIMLSAVGDSNNSPGSVLLQGIDHPELVGRTNYFDAQFYQFPNAVNPQDAVNLETFNLLLGNALNGQFVASTTNNVTYSILSEYQNPVITIASPTLTLTNTVSISGTNLLLKIPVSELTPGWTITASTNLAYLYSWPVFTNWYSIVTNAGIATFTIPILPNVPQYFYWPKGQYENLVTITPPLLLLNGLLYPSNTWSLYNATNGMSNFEQSITPSNATLIWLLLSNGAVYTKQLAP